MFEQEYERNLIINNRELVYKGIFRHEELFAVINTALEEKGYHKQEKKSEELVTPEGKKVYVELRPYKEKTNYYVLMIKIKVLLDNVTEIVETVAGEKRKFQKGDVTIIFDSWTMTDYEHRWGMRPLVFFIKGFINKYIWPLPLESGFVGELVSDTAYIYARIKKLLTSYNPVAGALPVEEEVRKQIAREIKDEIKSERKKA